MATVPARVAAVLEIPLVALVDGLTLPAYARPGDAGADLVAAEDVMLAPAVGGPSSRRGRLSPSPRVTRGSSNLVVG